MDNAEFLNNVLVFANSNPVCHLATIDGDQPHVRGMLMWFADETGFYFHTGSSKKLATQLKNGVKASIAFLKATGNPAETQELRVTGLIEILDDETLETRLYQERPWILENRKAAPEANVIIFKVCKGDAFIWNMSVNLREHTAQRVTI